MPKGSGHLRQVQPESSSLVVGGRDGMGDQTGDQTGWDLMGLLNINIIMGGI